ncbi:MAG: hypothetical protein HC781_03425 [Leptolyngbyaceae cyanobacterium CSU_1_4]|nr:hypothetical protein [Leptolyngbyaceae cyanobacterium CSU_1_4]
MSQEQRIDLGRLNAFLSKNAAIDLLKEDLRDVSNIDQYAWAGFEDEKENLIKQLKLYQRLLWVVPENRDDLATKLLENGITSPLQIVNTPEKVFIQSNLRLFGDDSGLAEQVYRRATALLRKVTRLQQVHAAQSDEPTDTIGNATSNAISIDLGKLNAFLSKNKEIDFRTADLLHAPNIDQLEWAGFEHEKESLINQLKAYQRVLRVVPPDREDLAKKLLQNGIQSSLQIASIPRKAFIQSNLSLFDQDGAIAEQIYLRALALRKAVALQYIAAVQQSEPHIHTTNFVR